MKYFVCYVCDMCIMDKLYRFGCDYKLFHNDYEHVHNDDELSDLIIMNDAYT